MMIEEWRKCRIAAEYRKGAHGIRKLNADNTGQVTILDCCNSIPDLTERMNIKNISKDIPQGLPEHHLQRNPKLGSKRGSEGGSKRGPQGPVERSSDNAKEG